MKITQKNATIASFEGVAISPELKFGYQYEELEKGDPIPEKEQLDEEDIRNVVNAKRNAKARAEESTKVLKANGFEKKALTENPQAQLNMMVKALVAAGNTPENALTIAKGLIPGA